MILKPLELSQMTGRSCIPVRHVRSRSFLHDNGGGRSIRNVERQVKVCTI